MIILLLKNFILKTRKFHLKVGLKKIKYLNF